MKSIQQRLQSRISRRSAEITALEKTRLKWKQEGQKDYFKLCNWRLKDLRHDQVLDKQIISSIYWRMF